MTRAPPSASRTVHLELYGAHCFFFESALFSLICTQGPSSSEGRRTTYAPLRGERTEHAYLATAAFHSVVRSIFPFVLHDDLQSWEANAVAR